MCNTPPVTRALWSEVTHAHPGRRTSSDGACPSPQHIRDSPNSDHNPDPNLGNDSCAADLSHDPAHGVDAYQLGEQFKHDPRVKYLIRPNFATHVDEIWNNERGDTHWRDADQHPRDHHEQGGGHLHISFWHRRDVLDNTSPWLAGAPAPSPSEDDVREVIYLPDGPVPAGPFKGDTPACLVYETNHGDPFLAFQLDGDELDLAMRRKLPTERKPALLFVALAIRPHISRKTT